MSKANKAVKKPSKFLEMKQRKKLNPYVIAFFVVVVLGSAIFEIINILFK